MSEMRLAAVSSLGLDLISSTTMSTRGRGCCDLSPPCGVAVRLRFPDDVDIRRRGTMMTDAVLLQTGEM